MIISRTPYRISFVGGGTDYHSWYQEHGAAVLATTINHYCYLHCRKKPPFFDHKSRIIWSHIEEVMDHSQIQHPSVRAILEYLDVQHGIEILHQGDLPARSGLGSSSAFTVGLLNAIYALEGSISSKRELACEAIHIERDILRENVGVQDQIQTAYGGFNKILISADGNFEVIPQSVSSQRMTALQDHLLLFFTGVSRTASNIAGDKIKSIPNKQAELHAIREMVDVATNILTGTGDITDFGRLLHEAWLLKRQLSKSVAPQFIDDIYEKGRRCGAIGGKLLGAGGGGFMLFFVKPEDRIRLCEGLKDLLLVPFQFENSGSQIIFYDNSHFSQSSLTRRDYQHLNPKSTEPKQRLTRLLEVVSDNSSKVEEPS